MISVIVFIHEFGHYWVAKKCGVGIEAFSIGFGKEIYGWDDKYGTRWKISLFPLGGYVQMYGDSSEASTPDNDAMQKMTEDEKQKAFHFKPLWQKALVVLAGPMANFILSIVLFFAIFYSVGKSNNVIPPIVGEVMEGGAAFELGLQKGDKIVTLGDSQVESFNDIVRIISINPNEDLAITYERQGELLSGNIKPKYEKTLDGLGNKIRAGRIGIKSANIDSNNIKRARPTGFLESFGLAVSETYKTCTRTLLAIKQIFQGKRSAEDLGGAPRIGKYVGQASEAFIISLKCKIIGGDICQKEDKNGFILILSLIALISANLGLVNLLPIPMLDGGHLAFYAIEAIKGGPINAKFQEYAFRLGFFILMCLMAFALFNDAKFFGLY